MFISDFAIRRPIITVVTMIALVASGLVSLLRLDTDEYPRLPGDVRPSRDWGGIASKVLTLVVIPTVYEIMAEWRGHRFMPKTNVVERAPLVPAERA